MKVLNECVYVIDCMVYVCVPLNLGHLEIVKQVITMTTLSMVKYIQSMVKKEFQCCGVAKHAAKDRCCLHCLSQDCTFVYSR